MKHFYQEIPGWTDFENLYADQVKKAEDGAVFVELGNWCGRSLAYLGTEIVNSGKQIQVHGFDLWHRRSTCWDIERVQKFFEEHGISKHITLHTSDSAKAAEQFADDSVDFAFIDACHDYGPVLRDIRAWYPKVKPGSTLAGHDYVNKEFPGVGRAVREVFEPRGIQIVVNGTSWVTEKPK